VIGLVIDAQGGVSDLKVETSSGRTDQHAMIDKAALLAAATCRFPPEPGTAPARARIPYRFVLQ